MWSNSTVVFSFFGNQAGRIAVSKLTWEREIWEMGEYPEKQGIF
jgi:hypothetical protein